MILNFKQFQTFICGLIADILDSNAAEYKIKNNQSSSFFCPNLLKSICVWQSAQNLISFFSTSD